MGQSVSRLPIAEMPAMARVRPDHDDPDLSHHGYLVCCCDHDKNHRVGVAQLTNMAMYLLSTDWECPQLDPLMQKVWYKKIVTRLTVTSV